MRQADSQPGRSLSSRFLRRLKQSIIESAKRQTEYLPSDSCADDDAEDSDPMPSRSVHIGLKPLGRNANKSATQLLARNRRSMSLHAAGDNLQIRSTFKDSFYEDEATSD